MRGIQKRFSGSKRRSAEAAEASRSFVVSRAIRRRHDATRDFFGCRFSFPWLDASLGPTIGGNYWTGVARTTTLVYPACRRCAQAPAGLRLHLAMTASVDLDGRFGYAELGGDGLFACPAVTRGMISRCVRWRGEALLQLCDRRRRAALARSARCLRGMASSSSCSTERLA